MPYSTVNGADRAAQPNVVLILIDDMGWADLVCYGSRFYRTPNLDRLAAEGMRFTQGYAACPVCSPTRAALLTGKYPARLHLTDYLPGLGDEPGHRLSRPAFRQELPLDEVTLAELLQGAGYATAVIGKWHLGDKGFEPTRQGFEVAIGGGPWGSVKNHFAPFLLRDAQPLPGLDQSTKDEYLTDRLTSEAVRFIETNRQRPFFLYLPHYAVHTPLNAKQEMIERYAAADKPTLQHNAKYAAMVESVDEGVGRIMAKLAELKLADNTLVIFTSDNGGLANAPPNGPPATNNAPLREGKGYLYEGGIRVPLLARWPAKIRAGATCATPVSSIDFLPTIAGACGVEVTKAVDGRDIGPLLSGSGKLEREAVFWHYPHYSPQGGKPGAAIRQGDYKLIEFYERGRRELFNVEKDPSENTNLVDVEPERARAMAARLADWRREVDAQMMEANPAFVPDTQGEDGTVLLPASTAEVEGVMLRFEPLPHKNTLGFWVRQDDWAHWQFVVRRPGKFEIEILQGCGTGSGGSQVDFTIGDQTVSTTVEETGGFQKFLTRKIGTVELSKAGEYTLAVKPRSKPGPAVMDLRRVRLVPVAK